jgi:hypothetical protein
MAYTKPQLRERLKDKIMRGGKGGKPGQWSARGKKATGERYLPKAARDALSPQEYGATTRKKREDLKKGKSVSRQPKKIAKKTARKR